MFPQVEDVNPPFPRPIAHWWYGCPDAPAAFDASGKVMQMLNGQAAYDDDTSESAHQISDIGFDAGEFGSRDS